MVILQTIIFDAVLVKKAGQHAVNLVKSNIMRLIDPENSDTGYSLSTDKDLEVVGNIFETKLDVPQETL